MNLEKALLRDGFGLGDQIGSFLGPFKEHAYCNTYNLHGGLHLFQRPDGEIEKCVNAGDGVIAEITDTILTNKRLPVYVAEGTSSAKLRKINSVAYLRHCYDKLRTNAATLFIYGHSADSNDAHIYRAIFSSEIEHIYFGVYRPNAADLKGFSSQLAMYVECH